MTTPRSFYVICEGCQHTHLMTYECRNINKEVGLKAYCYICERDITKEIEVFFNSLDGFLNIYNKLKISSGKEERKGLENLFSIFLSMISDEVLSDG